MSVAGAKSHFHGTLQAGQNTLISFELQNGDYLRGQIKATQHLQSAQLIDTNNEAYRQLLITPDSNSQFQILANASGTYQLRLVAAEIPLEYHVNIDAHYHNTHKPPTSTSTFALNAPSNLSPMLNRALKEWRDQGKTTKFWAQAVAHGTPLVETLKDNPDQHLVTFLYRGAERNVRLFGSPGGDHDPLYRLDDSDIWYLSYPLPKGSRLAYKLAPDLPSLPDPNGKNRIAILSKAQQDPLNKTPWQYTARQDRFTTESTLTMPEARQERWLTTSKGPGNIQTFSVSSQILKNTRGISIYRPADFKTSADTATPVLFFFDGQAYQSKIPTPTILDNLISEGRIPPVIAIFINNLDRASRSRELPCNPDFADFLAHELLPWVEQQTGIKTEARHTLLSGSSYGGLAAACSAMRHPDKFGLVLSQSGSFWWGPDFGQKNQFKPEWLSAQFAVTKALPIRFYLNAGLFESGWQPSDILPSNRHLYDVLRAKGYDVTYEETASGHDYFHWRVMLPYALITLLGSE